MLDRLLRPVVDPPLDRVAEWLGPLGVSANVFTWTGFAIGLAALPTMRWRTFLGVFRRSF